MISSRKTNRDGKVTSRDYSNKWKSKQFSRCVKFQISGWGVYVQVINYFMNILNYAVCERHNNVVYLVTLQALTFS